MSFRLSRFFVAFTFALLSAAAASPAQRPYHVLDHWKIGGASGWDYLLADPVAHRLYVTRPPRRGSR